MSKETNVKTVDFVAMRRSIFFDDKLSFAARGVLAWAFAHPSDKLNMTIDYLITQSPLGRDGVRSILNELKLNGYLIQQKNYGDGNRIEWHVIVTDEPFLTAPYPDGDGDGEQPAALPPIEAAELPPAPVIEKALNGKNGNGNGKRPKGKR